MPEVLVDWGLPSLLIGAALGIIKWMLQGAQKSIEKKLDEMRSDFDAKLKAVSGRITDLKSDVDEIERNGLRQIEKLHGRINELSAETSREFVRNAVFESVIGDMRDHYRSIHDMLTQLIKRG